MTTWIEAIASQYRARETAARQGDSQTVAFADYYLMALARPHWPEILAALRASVPDGEVSGPVDPTEEMLVAAHKVVQQNGCYLNGFLPEMYKAMLAAAPPAAQPKERRVAGQRRLNLKMELNTPTTIDIEKLWAKHKTGNDENARMSKDNFRAAVMEAVGQNAAGQGEPTSVGQSDSPVPAAPEPAPSKGTLPLSAGSRLLNAEQINILGNRFSLPFDHPLRLQALQAIEQEKELACSKANWIASEDTIKSLLRENTELKASLKDVLHYAGSGELLRASESVRFGNDEFDHEAITRNMEYNENLAAK